MYILMVTFLFCRKSHQLFVDLIAFFEALKGQLLINAHRLCALLEMSEVCILFYVVLDTSV